MITANITFADHREAQIIIDILIEMRAAAIKHPTWPSSPVERAAIVSEEAGEVIREANHLREGCGDTNALRTELLQTAGTCIRMLNIMDKESAKDDQMLNRLFRKGQSPVKIIDAPTANKKTIAYIAHPVGAVNAVNTNDANRQVRMNLEYIACIARQINFLEHDVVPFVPYYLDCVVMDDNNPDERARGIANGEAVLRSGMVDELRLYGGRISKGMQNEIAIARSMGIPVKAMAPETEKELEVLV